MLFSIRLYHPTKRHFRWCFSASLYMVFPNKMESSHVQNRGWEPTPGGKPPGLPGVTVSTRPESELQQRLHVSEAATEMWKAKAEKVEAELTMLRARLDQYCEPVAMSGPKSGHALNADLTEQKKQLRHASEMQATKSGYEAETQTDSNRTTRFRDA